MVSNQVEFSHAVVCEALLRDPKVRDSVKQAGEAALNDPSVQQQIVTVCKERFPEAAEAIASQVAAWAQDPVLQERAKSYAMNIASSTVSALSAAPEQIIHLIEQGPVGLRILALGGGVAQCVLAFFSLLSLFLGLGMVVHPIYYALLTYQLFFALSTALFEVSTETIERIPILDRWQNVLLEEAKFVSKTRGRGFIYLFLGILWLFESNGFSHIPTLLVGLYMTAVGALHALVSCGFSNRTIAQKLRAGGRAISRATVMLFRGASQAAPMIPSSSATRQARTPLCTVEETEMAETGGTRVDLARGDC